MARGRPDDDDGDDAPWLAEGVREERSTLVPRARAIGVGLVALALLALVAIGVFVASGRKQDGASVGYVRAEDAPLITADTGPYKVPPTDPGGASIAGVDDSIAATGRGDDPGSAIDATSEPEEPLARPGAATAAPTDLLPATIPPAAVVPPRAAGPTPPVAATRPAVPPPSVAKAPAPAGKPPAGPATTARAGEAPKPEPAKPAKTPPVKTHDADPLATIGQDLDAPAKSHRDAPAGGTATLQLGAFSTAAKADAAWAKAGGDGALAGLTKRIEPVERDGATLFRLRAGGVASKAAAAALCARLKAAGNACLVME